MKKQNSEPPFVNFSVTPEHLDSDGLWNPPDDAPPLEAAFQVNVFGSREHYLQLAEFLREFAERDTKGDQDYHEHLDGLESANGKVRFHVILRKDDIGTSGWPEFPRP